MFGVQQERELLHNGTVVSQMSLHQVGRSKIVRLIWLDRGIEDQSTKGATMHVVLQGSQNRDQLKGDLSSPLALCMVLGQLVYYQGSRVEGASANHAGRLQKV